MKQPLEHLQRCECGLVLLSHIFLNAQKDRDQRRRKIISMTDNEGKRADKEGLNASRDMDRMSFHQEFSVTTSMVRSGYYPHKPVEWQLPSPNTCSPLEPVESSHVQTHDKAMQKISSAPQVFVV